MPYDEIELKADDAMDKAVKFLRQEFRGVRTGRASPGLVDHIKVKGGVLRRSADGPQVGDYLTCGWSVFFAHSCLDKYAKGMIDQERISPAALCTYVFPTGDRWAVRDRTLRPLGGFQRPSTEKV